MARKASRGFTLIQVFLPGTLLLVVIGMLMQININYLDQIEVFDLHIKIDRKLDYWNSEVLSSMNQGSDLIRLEVFMMTNCLFSFRQT